MMTTWRWWRWFPDNSALVEVVPSPYIAGELRATAVAGAVTVPPITIVDIPQAGNPPAAASSVTLPGNPTAAAFGRPGNAAAASAPSTSAGAPAGVLSLAVAVTSPLNAFPPFERNLEIVFCPAGQYYKTADNGTSSRSSSSTTSSSDPTNPLCLPQHPLEAQCSVPRAP
ncbi:hypothetical protein CLOP_g9016 [Closterium sp. NIES-67]|nr:hypothetical protein CLOP_g9016 [Closterium sp. NIES-67]